MYLDDRVRALIVPSLFLALGAFACIYAGQAAAAGEGAWLAGLAVGAGLFTAVWAVTAGIKVVEVWHEYREWAGGAWDESDEPSHGLLPPPVPVKGMQPPVHVNGKGDKVPTPDPGDGDGFYMEAERQIRDAAFAGIHESFAKGTLLESDLRDALGGPDYEDALASADHRDGAGVLVSLGVVRGRAERVPGSWCGATEEETVTAFREAWTHSQGIPEVERRIQRRAAKLRDRKKRPGQVPVPQAKVEGAS